MLAFTHIPKTAGTTLHKVISQQYPRSKIAIHHDTNGRPCAELAAQIQAQGASIIMGHFSVGLHRFIPNLRYVTCIRDPISRLLSHYRHALYDPSHYLHREAKSHTFATYVSSGLSGELSDGMTRMLAGIDDFHHAEVTQQTLSLAISNLETLYDAVILSERFDEGLLLLATDLRWKTPYYISRKIGRHTYSVSQLDRETISTIEDHNRYDRQLYEIFAARFAARAEKELNLSERLADFQKANVTIGRAIFLGRELRTRYLW